MTIRYLALLFLAAFSLTGCDQSAASGGGKQGSGATSAGSGNAAEPKTADVKLAEAAQLAGSVKLELKNVEQVRTLLASKKGKVVVMDAWSTYCDPCLKEFPGLVALHKKYGPEKLACISLNLNYAGLGKVEDEIKDVSEFLQKQGATFDNILSTEADEVVYKKLDIPSVPAIFVYDQAGTAVKVFKTETTYAEVEKVLAPLLK